MDKALPATTITVVAAYLNLPNISLADYDFEELLVLKITRLQIHHGLSLEEIETQMEPRRTRATIPFI
jgi:hypothetical protein